MSFNHMRCQACQAMSPHVEIVYWGFLKIIHTFPRWCNLLWILCLSWVSNCWIYDLIVTANNYDHSIHRPPGVCSIPVVEEPQSLDRLNHWTWTNPWGPLWFYSFLMFVFKVHQLESCRVTDTKAKCEIFLFFVVLCVKDAQLWLKSNLVQLVVLSVPVTSLPDSH